MANNHIAAVTMIFLSGITGSYAFDLQETTQTPTLLQPQQTGKTSPLPTEINDISKIVGEFSQDQAFPRTVQSFKTHQVEDMVKDAQIALGFGKGSIAADLMDLNNNWLGGHLNDSTFSRTQTLRNLVSENSPDTLFNLLLNTHDQIGGKEQSITQKLDRVHDFLTSDKNTNITSATQKITKKIGKNKGPIGDSTSHPKKFDCSKFDNALTLQDQLEAFLTVFSQKPDNHDTITIPSGTYKNLRDLLAALNHQ